MARRGDALAISYAASDIYLEEPGDLPRAFVRALDRARRQGAREHRGHGLPARRRGQSAACGPPRGDIEAPVVVDAAGAWTRILGGLAGVRVPLFPARHQLCITEPLAQVAPTHPTVRIMDARVYVRPCHGGLMFGAYEPDPLMVDPRSARPASRSRDLEFDIEPLRRKMAEVAAELPVFGDAPIAELRGGLPTMTPDGHFIVDRLTGPACMSPAAATSAACRSRRRSARTSPAGSSTVETGRGPSRRCASIASAIATTTWSYCAATASDVRA